MTITISRHFYPDKEEAYTFWTYMMNCRGKKPSDSVME